MGDIARPVEGRPDQDEQALLITRTGNGPTVENEVELLEAEYGPADMSGVFPGSGEPVVEGELDHEDDAEAPVEDAPAEDPKGGASA